MMSLDEEISHLQKENSQVDSQLHRMKSDVGGMETEAASEDKVGGAGDLAVKTKIKHSHCFRRPRRSKDVTPSCRTTMKTSELTYSPSSVGDNTLSRAARLDVCCAGPKPVMRVPDADSQEKYDSYLTKLQNICTEPVGEEGTVKPVTESLKSALQNISVLPTPT